MIGLRQSANAVGKFPSHHNVALEVSSCRLPDSTSLISDLFVFKNSHLKQACTTSYSDRITAACEQRIGSLLHTHTHTLLLLDIWCEFHPWGLPSGLWLSCLFSSEHLCPISSPHETIFYFWTT